MFGTQQNLILIKNNLTINHKWFYNPNVTKSKRIATYANNL